MPPALLHKFPTSSPSDTTPLTSLLKLGYTRSDILGIIGKTEGNGCVNDFSRTLAAFVWENLLLHPETDTGASTGTSGTSTGGTSVVIFSGGTEGVLSPHVTFVVRERRQENENEKEGEGNEKEKGTGLKAAVGRTWQLQPWEIGGKSQVDCVAVTVRKMLEEEKIRPEQVALVLVKCPLLTSEKIAKIHAFSSSSRNEQLITSDTYESMALSRHASAIGVGVGLRELAPERVEEVLNNGTFHSSRASCSSGAELEACHILILASDDDNNPSPSSPPSSSSPSTEEKEEAEENQPPTLYRAFPGTMSSAIDITNLQTLLHAALTPLPPYTSASLIQIFAKAEADPTGMINQKYRHTMLTDSDVQSTRHARAAVGGLIAGVSGDCCVYVSGGAEGQGPRGGGGLCVVVRWEM